MPLDFPDSPSLNDIFTIENGRSWVWDGERWESLGVISSGGGSGSISVSETAPGNPEEGDLWFNSEEAATYIYYDNFWIQASESKAGPAASLGFQSKGQILVGTGPEQFTQLGVGNNGQVLIANSDAPSGLSWSENQGATTGKSIAMAIVFGG